MNIYDKREKIIYCYNCQSYTVYSCKDTHGNSGVESHCTSCGWYEWMNNAVALERQKWINYLDQMIFSKDSQLSVR